MSPIEKLLRGLLSANGRSDANVAVVDGMRMLLPVAWVALYEEDGGRWVCRAATGGSRRTGDALRQSPEPVREGLRAAADVLDEADLGDAVLVLDLVDAIGRTALVVIGPRLDGRAHPAREVATLARIAPDLSLALRRGDELDRLRAQAFLDPLTGCYNRRGFDEHLQVELIRAQRYQRPLALVLIDLDGFKRINDELGHLGGDHVLRALTALLDDTFRATDIISRYGGDEFAVIFPETSREEAVRLAEHIRHLLSKQFPDAIIARPVTASFGVAAYPVDAEDAEGLVRRADRSLYAAKTGGRDRVVAAGPEPEGT